MSAPPVIERVRTAQDMRLLQELVAEYERGLPPDLRHGGEPAFDAAFVARVDGADVGCVVVSATATPAAILQRLYVRPEHRGKGAARALTDAAVAYARACGCERIVLDTDARRLSAAYALYRSLGFEECEPYGPVAYASPTYMQFKLR